ncbi:MAG: hypothetical protein K8T91_06545 [Planctomycetes bacterium]|nr:hypothetical protein [Planctomycetota bacterium]
MYRRLLIFATFLTAGCQPQQAAPPQRVAPPVQSAEMFPNPKPGDTFQAGELSITFVKAGVCDGRIHTARGLDVDEPLACGIFSVKNSSQGQRFTPYCDASLHDEDGSKLLTEDAVLSPQELHSSIKELQPGESTSVVVHGIVKNKKSKFFDVKASIRCDSQSQVFEWTFRIPNEPLPK